MYYHVWFGTKRRKHLLEGEIGPYIESLFREIATEKSLRLVACKCFVDHAHLLLELEARDELPKAMQLLKGVSAYRIFKRIPSLKMDGHTNNLWRAGYGFREVPADQVETVIRYIRTQEERPENFDW